MVIKMMESPIWMNFFVYTMATSDEKMTIKFVDLESQSQTPEKYKNADITNKYGPIWTILFVCVPS
jgi:hypothetical protein